MYKGMRKDSTLLQITLKPMTLLERRTTALMEII